MGTSGTGANTEGTPLSDFPLDPRIAEIFRADGIDRLYPPQAAALGPVLEGKSVVLSCPTASGKSLVAYAAIATAVLKGGRCLYIVPLRALAGEKYRDLQAFERLGIKVGITMGEWDLPARELEQMDVLVATSEKADSLLRHKSKWMDGLSVVVADEVHLLRERTRGPTLEITLTRLHRHNPSLQVIALSATIANSRQLSEWLDAAHIYSTYRPVKLRYGVFLDGWVRFLDGDARRMDPPGDPVERLTRTAIEGGGQSLVFVNTRKSSESLADRLGGVVEKLLKDEEKTGLEAVSKRLLGSSEELTGSARKLALLVGRGTAYHNASLTNGERFQIEEAFRKGLLKCLVATPTLAAGVNLPARRVIVRDLTRYEDTLGMTAPLPVFEVQQMCGRAGRPRYDPYGEAILIARTESEEQDSRERYLLAPPEEVDSKLASESVLRTHLLALVASDEVRSEKELREFMQGTFYGHQLPIKDLEAHLFLAQDFLERHGLLFRGELRATPFGKMASDLYLDPVTAVLMRLALKRAGSHTNTFSYLAAVAATPDIAPMYLRRDDYALVQPKWEEEQRSLLLTHEDEMLEMDEETFLSTLKTAMALEEWIDDRKPLATITETYGLGAGDLHSRIERMEWLLSSMGQLARWERRALANPLDELSVRVRYGIRPELLELVTLRGIGRVRARLLYQNGLRTLDDLRKASEGEVAHILGSPLVAKDVLSQVKGEEKRSVPSPQEEERRWVQKELLGKDWP